VTLRAGAASRDITPELRGDFFGYVRPDLRVRGVAIRLHAHALVLDDGDRRVGLLTLDLGAPLIADAVFDRVAELGFDRANLLIAATHTHAGPSRPGPVVVDQVVSALRAATVGLAPATATWGRAPLLDANRNRSIEAHLANHGLDLRPGSGGPELDPDGEDHPRDVELRLLRVTSPAGRPIAAWGHFSAHPTTFVPANTLFSADFPGVATRRFRAEMGRDAPVAILTNGTEGDLIPRYDEVNQHACADRIGRRTAAAMLRAWEDAATGAAPVEVVAGGTRRIRYAGQELAPGVRVGERAWFGLPFVGGAVNGPSLLHGLGLEGRRRPAWLATSVHGRKLRVVPAPWPSRAAVTVLRLGDQLLLGVPGEPTVEAGRRMCAVALDAASTAVRAGEVTAPPPTLPRGAMVVGLAQAYRGYFTTPEEYDQQHYEGGHTVFGKHTSRLVQQAHAELATALVSPPAGDRPAVPLTGGHAGGHRPRLGRGARRLRVTQQPPAQVARLDVVTIGWLATRRGRDRPLDAPYLRLERHLADGRVVTAADDLGSDIVWRQRGRRAVAAYELPVDLPLGRYRFRVTGSRAEVASRPFEVVASRGLVVRGATVDDGDLVVHTQLPPPDPLTALRARDRHPDGGQLRVEVAGTSHLARPDGAGRYRLAGDALPRPLPASVRLGDGALRDRHGNASGAGRDLRIGAVTEIRWPPDLGPGGGRSPGPFGTGRRGRPRPWP
jgi:neutral ceramidase